MPSFRRTLTELWAGMILLGAGICQEAPDKTIRINVNLVQLDAIVTDAKGRQVTDLASEDFEILQDGEPQKITHFSYISTGTSRPAARGKWSPSIRPPSHDQIRGPSQSWWMTGLSFESTVRVRDALRKFVKEQMAPGDLVAMIRTSGGMGALEQFTTDKRQLSAAIDRIHFNALARAAMGDPADPRESAEVRASSNELDDFREHVCGRHARRDPLRGGWPEKPARAQIGDFPVRHLCACPSVTALLRTSSVAAKVSPSSVMRESWVPWDKSRTCAIALR